MRACLAPAKQARFLCFYYQQINDLAEVIG
jgi:hypothetical protein